MTRFDVDSLGCKISHTDAETIRDALSDAGHTHDANRGAVQVVNTCCITHEAEKKSRQRVRRLLDIAGDDGHVFVTGCGASSRAKQYTDIDSRVTVLPGAASQAVAAIIEAADALSGLACRGPQAGVAPDVSMQPSRTGQRARAFIKIQDGCDFHCSYCIVPTVRGEPRSRSLERVVADVDARVARGQREIVLTGVNIGLYRDNESRIGLDKLLIAVAERDGVERLRISSIESNHVNRRLVAAMASHPAICPHLHVPLQSGDDDVLKGMARHYDSARYARAIDAARSVIPQLNITTDIIVGYPTETDDSFERTLAFAQQIGFTKIHAFPYSERPGTASVAAADPIPKQVKAERSRRLRALADSCAVAHRRALVGTRDQVLVETRRVAGYGALAGVLLTDDHVATEDTGDVTPPREWIRTGYTRDYSPVVLAGVSDNVADGVVLDVELTSIDAQSGVLHAAYTTSLAGTTNA